MVKKYSAQSYSFALQLLAFSIPVAPFLVPAIIVCSIILFLFYRLYNRGNEKRSKYLLLPVLYYLLVCASALYSDHAGIALFDLEVKLSFLVIPLLFIFTDPALVDRSVLRSFVYGCLSACFICWSNSFYRYWLSEDFGEFFYGNFSIILHPSYFSLYLTVGMAVGFSVFRRTTAWIILVILFSSIVASSSKAGIVSAFVILPICFLLQVKTSHPVQKWLIFSAFFVSVFFVAVTDNFISRRFRSSLQSLEETGGHGDSIESGVARVLIWKAAVPVIKENFLTGVGNGDANLALIKSYESAGYKKIRERQLNAHNQFLQTLLSQGVIGLLLILSMLVSLVIKYVKTKEIVEIVFVISLTINLAAESMFETQAGVVFFCFFYALIHTAKNEINREPAVLL